MHARIMLLPGSDAGNALLAYAEQALCDIGAAFGHAFTFKEEKIGEQSLALYDADMTEETVAACAAVDAALVGDFACKGLDALAEGLACRLALRDMRVPSALSPLSPLKDKRALYGCVATPLALDGQSLRKSARDMMAFARLCDMAFWQIPAVGKAAEDWRAAVIAVSGEDMSNVMRATSAREVLPRVLASPERMGMVFSQSAYGRVIADAALALTGAPALAYEAYLGEETGVYAPCAQEVAGDAVNPLGVYRAVAALLRFSLRMEREAGCLDAAVDNVLAAGWRTQDIAAPGSPRIGAAAMADLVSEQVMLAGQFLRK